MAGSQNPRQCSNAGDSIARRNCIKSPICANSRFRETLRWGIAAACTVLLLKSDPGARKQCFVIILALESPNDLITGIKGDYGLWVACVGLAMKIFYHIPGPLEFPLTVYLFIAAAPASAVSVRGTLGGTTASTVVACICAYQYFAYMGGFFNAFKRERLIGSCAILFTTVACIFFFGMHATGKGGGKSG